MNIIQVYAKYQIMPELARHQLRVAGVAQTIVQACQQRLDEDSIVTACLLHDMGNILKFDLTRFPEFLQPEGLDYWQQVQLDYQKKYGVDEHEATMMIARELKVSDQVLQFIDAIGFSKIEAHYQGKDLAKMICEYADTRVAPQGVVSLNERLADLAQRYASHYSTPADVVRRDKNFKLAQLSEQVIFAVCKLKPEEITEASLNDTIFLLKEWQL